MKKVQKLNHGKVSFKIALSQNQALSKSGAVCGENRTYGSKKEALWVNLDVDLTN